MSYEETIENYINGNLTDFKKQYKNLKSKASFWIFVIDNYSDGIAKDAMRYLDRIHNNRR